MNKNGIRISKSHLPFIIRADANQNIGAGHIMRCVALAQAWQDYGGEAIFIINGQLPELEDRLKNEGFEITHISSERGSVFDANETVQIACDKKAGWIIVDGYHFGTEYQKIIKESGLSLLYIDDCGQSDYYCADIVLNQNIYADMSFYKKFKPYTRFLLGTNYVLLRREFLKWAGITRTIPEPARKVLVTFGGGDPDNITLSVIEALQQIKIDGLEVIVVVGGVNPNYETLQDSVKDKSGFSIRKNVKNMPELMAWADFAISAGGSTCWEFAYMGLPNLIIVIAENQQPIAEALQRAGGAKYLGNYKGISNAKLVEAISAFVYSSPLKNRTITMGSGFVDGRGGFRVISNMMEM